MRLINADSIHYTRLLSQQGLDMELVPKAVIDNMPTIDAVPVIRCKDCEEYIPWLEGDYICGRIGSYFGNTKPNDFCSRGVRKMDAGVEE